MKKTLIFLVSLLTPGLGQISTGRKTLGYSLLALTLLSVVIYYYISGINRDFYIAVRFFCGFLYVVSFVLLIWDFWIKNLKINQSLIFIITLFLIFNTLTSLLFIYQRFKLYQITSVSMSPGLIGGDSILVEQNVFSDLKMDRGDIITTLQYDHNVLVVQRIIGLPGDRIVINNNKVSINGKELPLKYLDLKIHEKGQMVLSENQYNNVTFYEETLGNHKYIIIHTNNLPLDNQDIVVPEDHFYVLGDNRAISADSKQFGPYPIKNFKGKFKFKIKNSPFGYVEEK